MGLDLTLLPFYSNSPTCDIAHTIIQCGRSSGLFDAIMALEEHRGRDVPATFTTYLSREEDQDTHYGLTIDTPYGEPLKYISAGSLAQIAEELIRDNPLNRAVWAYLGELPATWPVALYWH